jgi:hypothetical protein
VLVIWLIAALLFLVPAGDGFGEASASAEQIGTDRIRVELVVMVEGTGSVVAHLIEPGGRQETVSLADRGGGEFGAVIESRLVDLVVVFEVLSEEPRQSDPLRLTQLGVDRATLGMVPPLLEVAAEEDDSTQWGWLGLGFGAAALSMLAVWVLFGGRDGNPEPASEEETPTSSSS